MFFPEEPCALCSSTPIYSLEGEQRHRNAAFDRSLAREGKVLMEATEISSKVSHAVSQGQGQPSGKAAMVSTTHQLLPALLGPCTQQWALRATREQQLQLHQVLNICSLYHSIC